MNSSIRLTCGRCQDVSEHAYGNRLPIVCGHCGRKFEETAYEAELSERNGMLAVSNIALRNKLEQVRKVLERFKDVGYVKPGDAVASWYPFREALRELDEEVKT